MVQPRLSWLLETTDVFDDEIFDFVQHRSTGDSISDLVPSLEDTRAQPHCSYMEFLDINCALDGLLQGTTFLQV